MRRTRTAVTPSGAETRPPAAPPAASGRANTATFKTEPRAIKLPYTEQALAQLQQHSPMPASPAAAAPSEPRAAAPPAVPPAAAPPPSTATSPASPPRASSGRVPEIDDEKLDWIWPATGKIVSGFSDTANLKGIDMPKSGQPWSPAPRAGRVRRHGPAEFGKLIIAGK
jgi:lipoprotein NlpD